jgi:hypothetical protein
MDPLTITLIAVSAATAITSGVMDIVGQQEQADFNEAMARRNAAQQQANAQQQRNLAKIQVEAQNAETNAEVDAVRRKNQAILAQNRAEAGMLGIDTTGSSLLLAVDNAENAELEALEVQRTGRNKARQLQYEGDVQAYNYELAAQNSLMEADFIKEQAKHNVFSGILNTTGNTISAAADAYMTGTNFVEGYNKNAEKNKRKKIEW